MGSIRAERTDSHFETYRVKAYKYLLLSHATRILRVRLIRETDSTQACEYAFLPHIYHAHLAFVVHICASFNQVFRHFDMALVSSGKQRGPSALRAHNCILRDKTEVCQHLYLSHRKRTLSL